MDVLGDWAMWQRAEGLTERTVSERAHVVRSLMVFAGVGPEGVTQRAVLRFLGRPALKPSSRATYQASIKAFTRWAVAQGILETDPCAGIRPAKRPRNIPRPVHTAQLAKLLSTVNRRRTRMMILLAAMAGLRVHEVAKIHGHDVDLDAGTLTVTGKGGKTAIIPLHESIQREAVTFPKDDWWFPAYEPGKKRPVQAAAVRAAITRTMERAGFHATPHQLRHWYGTELLEQGADVRTVQELLRHDSIASTQIYTLVSPARRQAAIGRLELPNAA